MVTEWIQYGSYLVVRAPTVLPPGPYRPCPFGRWPRDRSGVALTVAPVTVVMSFGRTINREGIIELVMNEDG